MNSTITKLQARAAMNYFVSIARSLGDVALVSTGESFTLPGGELGVRIAAPGIIHEAMITRRGRVIEVS